MPLCQKVEREISENSGQPCGRKHERRTGSSTYHRLPGDDPFGLRIRRIGKRYLPDEEKFIELAESAFTFSPQILVEESLKGWKEIEFEVIRDANDHCFTVASMENFDPLGIHTGESIVVAPTCSLSEEQVTMLQDLSKQCIRHLNIVGECNIQYAFNAETNDYRIIEVNARLSRSSALASKATGYPLAFVAAKIALAILWMKSEKWVQPNFCLR